MKKTRNDENEKYLFVLFVCWRERERERVGIRSKEVRVGVVVVSLFDIITVIYYLCLERESQTFQIRGTRSIQEKKKS